MDKFINIGQLIKQAREEFGLTQEAFAEKLGVSKPTISLYESGERKPTLERILKIADILNIPISRMLEYNVYDTDLVLTLRSEGITQKEDIDMVKKIIETIKTARNGQTTK